MYAFHILTHQFLDFSECLSKQFNVSLWICFSKFISRVQSFALCLSWSWPKTSRSWKLSYTSKTVQNQMFFSSKEKNLWILSHSGNISVIYSNQSHWVQLSSTIFFMVSFIIRAPLSSTSYIFRILAISTTRNVFKIYRNDQRHVQQAFWLYLVSVWKRKNLNEFVCVVGC